MTQAPSEGAAPRQSLPACTIPGLPWQHQEHQPRALSASLTGWHRTLGPGLRTIPSLGCCLQVGHHSYLTPCTQVDLPIHAKSSIFAPLEAEVLHHLYCLLLLAPSGLAAICLMSFFSSVLAFRRVAEDINNQIRSQRPRSSISSLLRG